jgi:uracil-DNA glycosylase
MVTIPEIPLVELLHDIRTCTYCNELPMGPRPVLSINSSAKILIIGQAPGTRVHATGVSWGGARKRTIL